MEQPGRLLRGITRQVWCSTVSHVGMSAGHLIRPGHRLNCDSMRKHKEEHGCSVGALSSWHSVDSRESLLRTRGPGTTDGTRGKTVAASPCKVSAPKSPARQNPHTSSDHDKTTLAKLECWDLERVEGGKNAFAPRLATGSGSAVSWMLSFTKTTLCQIPRCLLSTCTEHRSEMSKATPSAVLEVTCHLLRFVPRHVLHDPPPRCFTADTHHKGMYACTGAARLTPVNWQLQPPLQHTA